MEADMLRCQTNAFCPRLHDINVYVASTVSAEKGGQGSGANPQDEHVLRAIPDR